MSTIIASYCTAPNVLQNASLLSRSPMGYVCEDDNGEDAEIAAFNSDVNLSIMRDIFSFYGLYVDD